MNREIKFRAWDKERKGMYQADFIDLRQEAVGFTRDDGRFFLSFDEVDLLQSTGLKDKNGKEIYEGDVIRGKHFEGKTEETVFEVIWHGNESSACFLFADSMHIAFHPYELQNKEVIGNIYENPELLHSSSNNLDSETK